MSKKICCLILSFLMIFGLSGSFFISPKEARAAESVNKYINVVYDDSGSMIKSDGDASSAEFYDKWCQAKYAMEVFSTMLSEGDTLNIFPMSLEGKKGLTLKGSQSAAERAKAVHDWQTDAKDTPYSVVEAAYADLQKQDKNTEKWLFIITDGQFEGGISSTGIKKDFDKFTSQGVKVIYLAIGDDVTKFENNEEQGLYCRYAQKSTDILSCMTEISNLISERLTLTGDTHVASMDNTLILNVDVPMEELIIFAQGDNISIGNMTNPDSEVKKESEIDVKYSDKANPNYQSKYADKIKVASNLSGVITTFKSADSDVPLSAGEYKVEVSDLSNVQIYYKANVDASVSITQNGEEVDVNDFIEPGKVQIEAVLKDPITKEVIDSDLMKDIHVTYNIKNGDETTTLESNGEPVSFDAKVGDLTADISIELPGNYTVKGQQKIQVAEPLPPLTIDQVQLENMDGSGAFKKENLMEHSEYALVTVKQDGKPLSEEYWEATDLRIVSDSDCLSFKVTKGDEVSTYKVEVIYDYDADETPLKDEAANCVINATLNYEGQAAKSEGSAATLTAEKLSLLHYWKELLGLLIIIIVILGYLPPFKKRFPRSLKKKLGCTEVPTNGIGKRKPYNGAFQKKFGSVIIPYRRERGVIRFLKPGVAGFPKMQVKAVSRGRMEITNASRYAGKKEIKFDNEMIEKGSKKYTVATNASITAIVGKNKYICNL